MTAWGLSFLLLLGLVACSKKPTWKEQYDLGMRYLTESNYEEAILAFTVAIEIDPNQFQAYIQRADAYQRLGNENGLEKAQGDYRQALALDDTVPEAYLGLARILRQQGALEEAVQLLSQGVQKTSDPRIRQLLEQIEKEFAAQQVDERFAQREGYQPFESLSDTEQTFIRQAVEQFESGSTDQIGQLLPSGMESDLFTMYNGYKIRLQASPNLDYGLYAALYNTNNVFISLGSGVILQVRSQEGQGWISCWYEKISTTAEVVDLFYYSMSESLVGSCEDWQFEGPYHVSLEDTLYYASAFIEGRGNVNDLTMKAWQTTEGTAEKNSLTKISGRLVQGYYWNGEFVETSDQSLIYEASGAGGQSGENLLTGNAAGSGDAVLDGDLIVLEEW